MKVTILGSGASYGIPSISRGYGDCDPTTPENNRTRCGLLVQTEQTTVLFDTGPEIRLQLVRAGIKRIDAVVYTHSHQDHMAGAGDLVSLLKDKPLPVYISGYHQDKFKGLVPYLLNPNGLKIQTIEEYKPFKINELEIVPILQNHGQDWSMGFKIGQFAYSTDVLTMEQKGFDLLRGIKTWVLGVTTREPSNKHVCLPEALKWIDDIHPERVYLTHMGTRMDYNTLCNELPSHVRPGYDGFSFNCEV